MTSLSPLMILTLVVALGLGIFLLVRFRTKHDPHPMDGERERNIDEIRRDGPSA